MTGKESTLVEFFYGTEPIIIPVYQRNYTWGKDDCKQLLDDIIAIAGESRKTHFIGSVVHVRHADGNIIIDGQQRITTLSLLLLAIRNAVRDGKLTADSPLLAKEIEFSFLINQFSPTEERRMKLKPFRDDCNAFDALFVDGGELIRDSKITENYLYFYTRLVDSAVDPRILLNAIKRLVFVRITLEPDHGDNAQQIFESINSTGVRLSESDKIRNYVLMGLDASTQERYYNDYWLRLEKNTGLGIEDFVRDYLTVFCGSIPKKDEVYFKFKQYASNNFSEDILPLLQSIKRFSDIYLKIKTCKVGSDKANEVMSRLEQLDLATLYPFFLAYFDYCEKAKLDDSETVKVLQTIEVFLFRRIMVGYYNTGLNKVFFNLHQRILKKQYGDWSYSDVLIYMLQNNISYWVFPNDKEFAQGFAEREVYKMRPNYRLYLFTNLEESFNKEAKGTKKKIEDGILSIEHIMPQTLTPDWREELGEDFTDADYDRWIHNIGNLTLTAYNSEYSNRKFSEKRDGVSSLPDMKGFRESCVAMNKYVSSCEHWTVKEMEERCKKIAAQAMKIWPYPQTSFTPQALEEEFIPIDADYQFRGRYVKNYMFRGVVVPVDSWASAFVKFVKNLYEIDSTTLHQLVRDQNELFYEAAEANGYSKIADSIYLYVACSTDRKISQMQKLLSLYGFDPDEISFSLHSKTEEKEENTLRMEFWKSFNAEAGKDSEYISAFKLRKPADQSWQDQTLGTSKYWVCLTLDTTKNQVSCGIYIGDDFGIYDFFLTRKGDIETIIGEDVIFSKANKASRFRCFANNMDINNRDQWPEIFRWYRKMALKFKEVHSKLGK